MRNVLRRLRIPLVLTAVLVFTVAAGAAPASACGTRPWRVVNSPNASSTGINSLLAVTAISANNVWAVGYPTERGVLIEHWNGTRWDIIPGPSQGTTSDTLRGIAAVSARDIWAVGDRHNPGRNVYQTLIEHWNGATWSIIASPNVGPNSNTLYGVAAISKNNVWAVGSSYDNVKTSASQTLIEHWDGVSWWIVASPNVGMGNDILWAVARVPGAHQAWAVGTHSGATYQTLTEYEG